MSSSGGKRPAAVPIRPGVKITQPTTGKSSLSSSLPPTKSSTTTTVSWSSSSSSSSGATKINTPSARTSAQPISLPSSRTTGKVQQPSSSSSSSSFSHRSSSLTQNPYTIPSSSTATDFDDEEDNEYDLPTASASSQRTNIPSLSSSSSSSKHTRSQKYSEKDDEDEDENNDEYDRDTEPQEPPPPSTRTRRRTESVSASTVPSSKKGTSSTLAHPITSSSSSSTLTTIPPTIVRPVAVTKYGIRQFVESQHGLRLFLQNCVASCDLKCNPDLPHIATHARNAEYNPQRFAAVILRLREPRSTALIFGSGKVVLTGARNEEDSLLGIRKICKIIQVLGFPATIGNFNIQNLVATGDCGFPIRLEGMADEHSKFSSYEPELFPGLIYRMVRPKIVFLVFVSGKIVITGAKTRSDVVQGINSLYPVLFKYRKALNT